MIFFLILIYNLSFLGFSTPLKPNNLKKNKFKTVRVLKLNHSTKNAIDSLHPKYLGYGSKAIEHVSLSTVDKMALSNFLDLDESFFEKPDLKSFKAAFKGYSKLKKQGVISRDILTIIDFSLSSTQKRLWVIDMNKNKIIFQSVVSHGKNSGEEYADSFSNTLSSNKSSLGFYKTAETYYGTNGLSLRLDGLEKGINDNARARDIVIHGAKYADESLAHEQGYLGRSLGCPALPFKVSEKIINYIQDETCLFIYKENNEDYLNKSTILN